LKCDADRRYDVRQEYYSSIDSHLEGNFLDEEATVVLILLHNTCTMSLETDGMSKTWLEHMAHCTIKQISVLN